MLTFDICTGDVENERGERSDRSERVYAKWRKDKKDNYLTNIESNEVDQALNELGWNLLDNTDVDVLEQGVLRLGDILTGAGAEHIHTVRAGNRNDDGKRGATRRRQREGGGDWHDDECKRQQDVFWRDNEDTQTREVTRREFGKPLRGIFIEKCVGQRGRNI